MKNQTCVADTVKFEYVKLEDHEKCWSTNNNCYFKPTKTVFIAYKAPNTPAKTRTMSLREIVQDTKEFDFIEKSKTLGKKGAKDISPIMFRFDNDGSMPLQQFCPIDNWNGTIFIDIDIYHSEKINSKYTDPVSRERIVKQVFNVLNNCMLTHQETCLYSERTASTGMHFLFYFNVDKTAGNFAKCAEYAKKAIMQEAQTVKGLTDVIKEPGVFDDVYNRPFQKCHMYAIDECINEKCTGNVSLDEIELELKKDIKVKDVDEDGKLRFTVNGYSNNNRRFLYHYPSRFVLYTSIAAITSSEKECNDIWVNEICPRLITYDDYTTETFIKEAGHKFHYDKVDKTRVSGYMLKEWGYDIDYIFTPMKIDTYNADEVVDLNKDEYVDIERFLSMDKKIIHLYAGCGVGKTTSTIKLAEKGFKVCFIAPMRSILSNNFDKYNSEHNDEQWFIVDGDHNKGDKHNWRNFPNVATTWDSFYSYEMYKGSFDLFVFDEIHTLYQFDFRTIAATNAKKGIHYIIDNDVPAKIVFMTGTPSAEIQEFECYKVKVNKELHKVDAEMVFYNKDYSYQMCKEIAEWISKDDNNKAYIFFDKSSQNKIESFEHFGIKINDAYIKTFADNVDKINATHNIDGKVSIFSVYAQVGINLDNLSENDNILVYIISEFGSDIVQYANRIRDKKLIHKVVIPIKKNSVANSYKDINRPSDICVYDLDEKINMINSRFSVDKKYNIQYFYGIPRCVVDKTDKKFIINEDNWYNYKYIINCRDYDHQTQVIYNRLIDNDFNVKIYMTNELVDPSKKFRSNRFNGMMMNFDFDNWLIFKDDKLHIGYKTKLGNGLNDETKHSIEFLLNYCLKNNPIAWKEDFNDLMHKISESSKDGNISQANIKDIAWVIDTTKNTEDYGDPYIIDAMLSSNYNVEHICTRVAFDMVTDNMIDNGSYKNVTDEIYKKIDKIYKVVTKYPRFFDQYKSNTYMDYIGDDMFAMQKMNIIYSHLQTKHTRGRKKKEGEVSRTTEWRRKNVSK